MNKTDAKKLIAVLMVTYPNYKPVDVELTAKIWADVAEDCTYEQMDMALKSYIKSNASGFPPVPGQIIDLIHKMTVPAELNEMEAWALVSKAIRNSGYNSVEEFAKLPPLVQKAVGLPGQLRIWALDENYSEDVVSSNFIKCYKSVCAREMGKRKMPEQAQRLIEQTDQDSYPAQIEQMRQESIRRAAIGGIEDKADISEISENTILGLIKLKEALQ